MRQLRAHRTTAHVDGRVVRTSRSAPAMRDDPEAGEPAGNDARNAVCYDLVESTERAGQWHGRHACIDRRTVRCSRNGRRAPQTTYPRVSRLGTPDRRLYGAISNGAKLLRDRGSRAVRPSGYWPDARRTSSARLAQSSRSTERHATGENGTRQHEHVAVRDRNARPSGFTAPRRRRNCRVTAPISAPHAEGPVRLHRASPAILVGGGGRI